MFTGFLRVSSRVQMSYTSFIIGKLDGTVSSAGLREEHTKQFSLVATHATPSTQFNQ